MTLGRLVDGLHERGVSVTVIVPGRKDRPDGSRGSHDLISVPGFPLPRYPELRFGLPAHRRLRELWTNQRPDLVHIATEGPLGWSALRVAQSRKLPVVSSFHTNFHSYGRHYGFGLLRPVVLRWLRNLHNRTLRTFVPSQDIIDLLAVDDFRNLRLFARGVDTTLFGPHRRNLEIRRRWGAEESTPVALYVGRLAGEKNLPLVIAAFKRMQSILPDLKLVLVGDGPERERIQRNVPEAHFAGMRQGTDLAAHYASADAFLFGSITETFGNVVTEAMASGLAVLAYQYAAPGRFIRHGDNGFLAPFNNEAAFLKEAERLAGEKERWSAVGLAARETILPQSWDSVIEAYLNELKALQPSTT